MHLSWKNFGAARTTTIVTMTIPMCREPDSPGVIMYPLDCKFGIPGPFGHGNRLPTYKYLAMQPQLCMGSLGAL